MAGDKPLISIVLAVYHPRMDWLIEQLDSLNAQTYPNLELIVCDDGPDEPVREQVFAEHITAFQWELVRNEENVGSNKTFERLTTMARGEYIAYCDQDDVWLPEKLSVLEKSIVRKKALLVCSDVIIINENGWKIADSITTIRPRHSFMQESMSAACLIYRNVIIGCTMLIRREIAEEALPFADTMVHDHYLAFFCSMKSDIAISREHLVQYRIHGGNQTGILACISNRQEYLNRHLMQFCRRVEELRSRFSLAELDDAAQWAAARQENAEREPGGIRELWKLRGMNLPTTLFEIVGLRLPQPIFRLALRMIQTGKI